MSPKAFHFQLLHTTYSLPLASDDRKTRAAIDADRLLRDEAGRVAGEEETQLRHLFRCTDAFARMQLVTLLQNLDPVRRKRDEF